MSSSSSSSKLKLKAFKIPLKEIKLATNNFSQENYIGGGGFGKVYKGKLSKSRTNRTAAIKRLDPKGLQGKHEFLNELSMLSTINHQNIIPFIGYCDEGVEMIIAYEYAVNQSLDQHLRDTNKMRCITWLQRIKICIDVATGLNYLHSGVGSHHRIIHRDVKSSNILLDDNLQAKITDFGLSKLGLKDQPFTQIHTRVAGTDCYCDPYYLETSTLTKESDVYSFGVVLFEMLCGRLVFPRDKNSPNLIQLIRRYYEQGQKLTPIIDPYISDQIDSNSLGTFEDIAHKCIDFYRKNRPTMDIIITKLKEALEYQENHDLEKLIQSELYSFVWIEIHVDKENHQLQEPIQSKLVLAETYNERTDEVWEKRLPHDYKKIIERSDTQVEYNTAQEMYSLLSNGIFLDCGKKWFCLSKLNGKNCLAISAKELFTEKKLIIGWNDVPGSRFVNVPKLDAYDTFEMQITTQMLSLKTTYAVYFICKPLLEQSSISANCIFQTKNISRTTNIYTYSSELREDGWMELELFHFDNNLEVVVFEFQLRLANHIQGAFYAEGIEFRPIDMVTEIQVKELPKSELDTDWEKMLPNNYEEIIKRSDDDLHYTTKKQLCYLLGKGIYIDDKNMRLFMDTSTWKICIMLSTNLMTIKQDGEMQYTTAMRGSSRSSWVMTFPKFKSLEIEAHMKAYMLSPKTPYAAWLVFCCNIGSMDYSYGSNIAWLALGKQEQQTRYVHLGSSSSQIRPLNDPEIEKGLFEYRTFERKLDRRPRKRDDGWHEVELFPFFNDADVEDEVVVGLKIKEKYIKEARFQVQAIEFRPQGN